MDATQERMNVTTQKGWVLRQLKAGRQLTAASAVREAGIYRLAARVYDLRKLGHDIKSRTEHDANGHWAVYWMSGDFQP